MMSKAYDMVNFLKLKQTAKGGAKANTILKRKLFFEYKSKTRNSSPKEFSLEDILTMPQDEVTKRIFTFNKCQIQNPHEYSKIRDVIKSCSAMNGISAEYLPSFFYF